MGKLEKEAARRRKMGKIQEAALATIALSGVLALALVAPNMLQLLGGTRNKHRLANQSKSIVSRLAKDGYITFESRGTKKYARITNAGRAALFVRGNEYFRLSQKPKRWDERWRMVLFDIPQKRKNTRDQLRFLMRKSGFHMLQNSAWVYPYDCEDVVALIKAELKLGTSVQYLIVEKVENDAPLRSLFLLK